MYTEQQIIDTGIMVGLTEKEARVWYLHYAPQGFRFSSDVKMTNISLAMRRHKADGTLDYLMKKYSKSNPKYIDIDEVNKRKIRDDYYEFLNSKTTEALEDLKKDKGHIGGLCGWLIDEILSKRKASKERS